MVYANDILAARNTRSNSIAALVADLRKAWANRRSYNRTVSELQGLSDRELADLGLHHSQIQTVARESVYGQRA
jgi:uncharacterized protein YjiS (DUF1127 family)